ncbi:T-box transcription factor tbx21 [Linnemannia zychae]|nr:T-box transcription factor tbx21 [Linnemannia zychae]
MKTQTHTHSYYTRSSTKGSQPTRPPLDPESKGSSSYGSTSTLIQREQAASGGSNRVFRVIHSPTPQESVDTHDERASKRIKNNREGVSPVPTYKTAATHSAPTSRKIPVAKAPKPASVQTRSSRIASQPCLVLSQAALWSTFKEHETEMILSTSGRSLFPLLTFEAKNLDPEAAYAIQLDFEKTTDRLRFHDGKWHEIVDGPLSEIHKSTHTTNTTRFATPAAHSTANATKPATRLDSPNSYMHPASFQLGRHWMADTISFSDVRLSNKDQSTLPARKTTGKRKFRSTTTDNNNEDNSNNTANTNVFTMQSFAKYRPRLRLIQRSVNGETVVSSTMFVFDEASFIAVTRYANKSIIALKTCNNPHARGFLKASQKTSLPRLISNKENIQLEEKNRIPTITPNRANKRPRLQSSKVDLKSPSVARSEIGGDVLVSEDTSQLEFFHKTPGSQATQSSGPWSDSLATAQQLQRDAVEYGVTNTLITATACLDRTHSMATEPLLTRFKLLLEATNYAKNALPSSAPISSPLALLAETANYHADNALPSSAPLSSPLALLAETADYHAIISSATRPSSSLALLADAAYYHAINF